MSSSFRPATDRLHRFARALELKGTAGTFGKVAGGQLKAEVDIAAKAAFGTDLRPFASKKVRAGFGYDVTTTGRGCKLTFKLRPAGVWAFGEHGAHPHLIGIKRVGSKRKIRTGYVFAAGYKHPVRGPVYHPGTNGTGAIRYVFKRVRRAQLDAVTAGVLAAVKGV